MSLAFESSVQAGARRDAGTIQKMLDENAVLIQTIVRYQRLGRVKDALQYQQLLHRNLVYLASLADEAALKEELEANNTLRLFQKKNGEDQPLKADSIDRS